MNSQARLPQTPMTSSKEMIIQITLLQSCQAKVWIDKNGETRILLKHQKGCWINQQKSQHQIKIRITNRYGETCTIPTYRNGCKNSERILWMIEFLKTETHTRVLLMNYLSSLWEVCILVNTMFILISLKTEIARSVKGPKLQGPQAEDAMAEPYLVLKNLVTW